MRKILITLITILTISFTSCESSKKEVHKLKDGKGYCYQDPDDLLWYIYYYNVVTGTYDVQTSTSAPSYNESVETVNSDELNVEADLDNSQGEYAGGSESDSGSDSDGGMDSDSGSDGGGDSGGGE